MTNRAELLHHQVFEADGHVTELCVTCVADGELALVPAEALGHIDACDTCGRRLGEAALLSALAADALRVDPARALVTTRPHVLAAVAPRRKREPGAPPPRRSVPVLAIAAALAVAAVTAWPGLSEAAGEAPAVVGALIGWIPLIVRLGGALLFGETSAPAMWVRCAAALSFLVTGIMVARVASRVRTPALREGGSR